MAKATSTPASPASPETSQHHAAEVPPVKAPTDVVEQPEILSPTSLLTIPELHAFHQASSSSDKLSILVDVLHVQHYSANPRSTIWIDYLFGILCFAHDEVQFSDEKTLVLLQLAHQVFEFATTSNTNEFPSIEAVYTDFRERIRVHSVAVPPSQDSDIRFSTKDVAQIVLFMTSTFFRHVSAYQYVYEYARQSFTRQIEVAVEVPMPSLPLSAAQLIE